MEMTLKGTPKEFAALVLELQERQDAEPEIIPDIKYLNRETYLLWKSSLEKAGKTPGDAVAHCRALGLTEYSDRLEKALLQMEETV